MSAISHYVWNHWQLDHQWIPPTKGQYEENIPCHAVFTNHALSSQFVVAIMMRWRTLLPISFRALHWHQGNLMIAPVQVRQSLKSIKTDMTTAHQSKTNPFTYNIHGLVQERRKSIANALELCLSCTNTSVSYGIYGTGHLSLYTQSYLKYWTLPVMRQFPV